MGRGFAAAIKSQISDEGSIHLRFFIRREAERQQPCLAESLRQLLRNESLRNKACATQGTALSVGSGLAHQRAFLKYIIISLVRLTLSASMDSSSRWTQAAMDSSSSSS